MDKLKNVFETVLKKFNGESGKPLELLIQSGFILNGITENKRLETHFQYQPFGSQKPPDFI